MGEAQKLSPEQQIASARERVRVRPRLHRRRRGGVRHPRSRVARARQPLRRAAGGGGRDPARGAPGRRADRLGDRGADRPVRDLCRGRRGHGRAAPPAARARGALRRPPRRDRHPSLEPVAGAAHHRHTALPPERRDPALRRLAQQQLRASRPRGHSRSRSGDPGDRRPAGVPAAPARVLGELAVRRRCLHVPSLGAHADLHANVPAVRDPGCVRQLARVRAIRPLPLRHGLDHGAHAALVERPPSSRVPDRRNPDLRRPARPCRSPVACRAHVRARRAGGARGRRGRAVAGASAPAPGGEPLAGDPLRALGRPHRPRHRRGAPGAGRDRAARSSGACPWPRSWALRPSSPCPR